MKTFSKITASHFVLPSKVLTNEELFERFGEKKVRGISKLSGIRERRVAPEGVTAADLGAQAAKRMIEAENIDPSGFDMLIFVSQTPDYILPASAFVVHERLGLSKTCGAFDISMGCAAMPYAISVANGLIASGQSKKILLVFAETITKLIYEKDRSLLPLHGDGAAAFVLEPSGGEAGVEFVDLAADSSGWRHLIVPAGGMRTPRCAETSKEILDDSGICTTPEHLQMNGAAVFHFSISAVPEQICSSLQKRSLKVEDFNCVLLHQANKMMLDQIYSAIGASESQRFFFMEEVGNLSAASTPVLLAKALRDGMADGGARFLLASFGVGLTWGVFAIGFEPGSVGASKSASTDY